MKSFKPFLLLAGGAALCVLASCGDSGSSGPDVPIPGGDSSADLSAGSSDAGSGDPGSGGGTSQPGGNPGEGGSTPVGTSSASGGGQQGVSYEQADIPPKADWVAPTCVATGSEIPANDPCVQYFGRWDLTTAPQAPTAAWSATYVKMKFTGTGVSIKLNTSSSIAFYSSIDGGTWTRVDATCDPDANIESCRNRVFQLATGLAAGTHEMAFYRASEGGYGMHDVLGYVVENGTIAVPNAPSARTIECMGNSITAGLGADGVGSSYEHDNTLTAWCVQTALKLGADWTVVAHSGQGMYKNLDQFGGYAGQTEYGHVITMYDEYQWTHYPAWSIVPPHDWSYNAASAREQWHFRDVPDVAIFAIGTNDFINISQNSTVGLMTDAAAKQQAVNEYLAAFKAKYDDFLSFVRSKYPKSRTTIFVHGTILNDDAMQSYTLGNNTLRQLVAERTAAGDDRIFFIDPAGWLTQASDFSGDWTHPTAAGHQVIANRVSAIVKEKMGWQ